MMTSRILKPYCADYASAGSYASMSGYATRSPERGASGRQCFDESSLAFKTLFVMRLTKRLRPRTTSIFDRMAMIAPSELRNQVQITDVALDAEGVPARVEQILRRAGDRRGCGDGSSRRPRSVFHRRCMEAVRLHAPSLSAVRRLGIVRRSLKCSQGGSSSDAWIAG